MRDQVRPSPSDSASSGHSSRPRSPLVVIFLTIFIDLVGFGILIPTMPFIARQFGATAADIGLLMAIYSFTQFLFSPFWGSLSDRVGRRPVILLSLLGCSASYVLFAFSRSLTLLFIARGLAGAFGGNISTAHAYIGDVTSPSERSKGMGLIGAAFGLGFVFGPIIGGALGLLGQKLGSEPPFGLSFAALGIAFLCLLNCLFAYLKLNESLPAEVRAKAQLAVRRHRFQAIFRQVRRPIAGRLIVVYFLSGLAMAEMEAMLIPYMADRFAWGLKLTTYGFAYIGFIMLFVQGYLIRKWMPKFGEPRILAVGLALFALSLYGISMSATVVGVAISMTILAFGNGLMRPPNLGIISLTTPAEEQGASMGVTNSLASLGRILGPAIGGYFYIDLTRIAPFLSAGVVATLALILTLQKFGELPQSGLQKAVQKSTATHE